MKLHTFRIGGVHPDENKITAEARTKNAELPKVAIFPLGQHIGAPATVLVAKGENVKTGQLIAKGEVVSVDDCYGVRVTGIIGRK